MKKLLSELKRNCKGAVTVFVTLLLIPAVLITGTGVDIARLYTARSEMHNANQLAANSALASYDALLQDLYGLYGIMQSDAELSAMMRQYIEASLLDANWFASGMGTFSMFRASENEVSDVSAQRGDALSETDVLRRQIEEYVKFRAPAFIAEKVISVIKTFEKTKADAEVMKDVLGINDKIEEIDETYKKLYDCINEVNKAQSKEVSLQVSVNDYVGPNGKIEKTFEDLYSVQISDYYNAMQDGNEELAADYENIKYPGLFDNLNHIIVGGEIVGGYIPGDVDENGDFQDGYFTSSQNTKGLNGVVGEGKSDLDDYISNNNGKDDSLEDLVKLAKKAEEAKQELSQKVDALEEKLYSGNCSDTLTEGFTEAPEDGGKSQIEEYRALLKYDLNAMAGSMNGENVPILEDNITELENISYGKKVDPNRSYSRDRLKNMDENDEGCSVQDHYLNTLSPNEKINNIVQQIDALSPDAFAFSRNFVLFQNISSECSEFYDELVKLYSNPENKTKKSSILDGLSKMAGEIQDQFNEFFSFTVEGAEEAPESMTSNADTSSSFGSSGSSDWSEEGAAEDQLQESLGDDIINSLAGIGNEIVDKVLVLSYGSEMFSCYITPPRGSDDGEETSYEKNMAGIPMDININYFFQSELEYLYGGSNMAMDNLKAVAGMMFLIRSVMNYVTSFSIPSVNETVSAVKSSLAFLGPGAIAIGELVRVLLALGESVSDVGRLKSGVNVAVIKTKDTWTFSLRGLLSNISQGVVGALSDSTFNDDKGDDDGPTMGYEDYLILFLLFISTDDLTGRIGHLIQLNVTNYENDIGQIESKADRQAKMTELSQAGTTFRLNDAATNVSVRTTVNLDMLFLSLPMAQNGYVEGVVPPKTKQLVVSDYRGY